jgi:hypothetical protein
MVVETMMADSEEKAALLKLVLESGNMVMVDIGELPWYEATKKEVVTGTAAKTSVNTWFVHKDLYLKLRLKNGKLDVNGEHFQVVGPETSDLGKNSQEYAGAKGATMQRQGGVCVSPSPGMGGSARGMTHAARISETRAGQPVDAH